MTRMAWKNNLEYRLKEICCRKLSKSPIIQFQDGKWYLFDSGFDGDHTIIHYCPYCGKRFKHS
jgi:hypothetical protein